MTAALGGGELATEWVTILPETATLARRLREFRPAPIKVKVEVDTDQMERDTRDSGRKSGRHIDTEVKRETRGTGRGAARNIADGLNDRSVSQAAARLGRTIRHEVENETRKLSFKNIGSGLLTGFRETAAGTMQVIRNIGTIALVARYASKALKTMSLSLLASATAARAITGVGISQLGTVLGVTAKVADRLAKSVARVTSAILVATAVAKGLKIFYQASRWAGILSVGLGTLTGVTLAAFGAIQAMGPGALAVITSLGSAMGIAAGAAAGLLGPMLAVAKIGFQGMSEGIKAVQKDWKDVDEAFAKTVGERMRPMLDAWHNLSMGITDTMSSALKPAFGNLGELMNRLAPAAKTLAGTFGDLGNEVTRGLLGPEAQSSLDQMFAASNRFFRSFLGESGITGVTTGLLKFSATAADAFSSSGDKINELLLKFGQFLRGISADQMRAVFDKIAQAAKNVWVVLQPVLSVFRSLSAESASALAPGFKAIGQAIKDMTPGLINMARILMPALSKVMENLAPALPALISAFTPWSQILAVIAPIVADLVTKLVPFAPIILAVTTALKAGAVAIAVYNTAMLLFTNATKIARAAQWLFNAALAANPIGLVVVAIAAVVAALALFFTKTEAGRKIWDKLWTGMKEIAMNVWNWIKTEGPKLWESIKPSLESLWKTLQETFAQLQKAFKDLWPQIQPVLKVLGELWLGFQKIQWKVIIEAVKAFVTGVVWWVTNVLVPAFKMMIERATAVWNALKAVFGFIKGAFEALWAGAQIAWSVGETVFHAIETVASAMWENVLKPIFDAFGAAWDFLGDKLNWFIGVWNAGWDSLKAAVQVVWDFLKPVRDFIGDMFQHIGDMGKQAGDAIKSAWSGLTNVLKEPLHALGRFLQGLPDSVFGIDIPFVGTLKGWGQSLAGLAGGGVIKGPGTGTSDSILGLDKSGMPTARVSNGEGVVPAKILETPLGRALFAALLSLPGLKVGGVAGSNGSKVEIGRSDGLNPGAAWLSDYIKKTFGVKDIGGRRSEDGYGEHSSGNAIDIMVGSDKGLGDRIAGFLKTNKESLGLNGMIWQQRSYGYGGDWNGQMMNDRGSPTQNHMDHIHAILGSGRGANAAAVGLPSGPIVDPSGRNITGASTAPGSISAMSGGGGSGGTLGTGGSYVVDPKKVREGEDRVTDMTNALDIKQQKLDEYLQKQAAGEKVNESTINAARDAVTKQQRELEQAQSDLEAVKQGTWKEDKSSDKSAQGKSDDWSSVGGMIFNGFLESMGFDGSVFKNLFDTPNVKSAIAGVNWGMGVANSFLEKATNDAGGNPPQDLGLGGGGSGGMLGVGTDILAGVGDATGLQFPTAHGDQALAGQTPGPGNVFDLRGSQLGVSPGAFEDKMGEMTAASKRHPTLGP